MLYVIDGAFFVEFLKLVYFDRIIFSGVVSFGVYFLCNLLDVTIVK